MPQTEGSVVLYYTQGNSDKFYEAGIDLRDDGLYDAWTRYGRRGASGTRRGISRGSSRLVALRAAQDALGPKIRKGYTPHADGRTPATSFAQWDLEAVCDRRMVHRTTVDQDMNYTPPARKRATAKKVATKKVARSKTAKERADEMRQRALETPQGGGGSRSIDFDEI